MKNPVSHVQALTDTYNQLVKLEAKQTKARNKANVVRLEYLQEGNIAQATKKLTVRSNLMDKVHDLNQEQLRLTRELTGIQKEVRELKTIDQEDATYFYIPNRYNYAI